MTQKLTRPNKKGKPVVLFDEREGREIYRILHQIEEVDQEKFRELAKWRADSLMGANFVVLT